MLLDTHYNLKVMTRNILQTFLFLVIWGTSEAQNNYPATKTVDSSDTYFGVTYKDPYRWLENLKDSTVVNWLVEQKAFTDNSTREKQIPKYCRQNQAYNFVHIAHVLFHVDKVLR